MSVDDEDYEARRSIIQKNCHPISDQYYKSKTKEIISATYPPLPCAFLFAAASFALEAAVIWATESGKANPSSLWSCLGFALLGGYLIGVSVRLSINKKIGIGLFFWGPIVAATAALLPFLCIKSNNPADFSSFYVGLATACTLYGVGSIWSRKAAASKSLASLENERAAHKAHLQRNLADLAELEASHNKKAEHYADKIDTLTELKYVEVLSAVEAAIARAEILRVVDIKKTTEELQKYNAQVNALHDKLTLMVQSNKDKNLPEEADWAAIDALYDRVYRGYADTRKEALLQVHADDQHAQLIASMAANYKQLQELRTQASRQLESIADQEAQLALIAQDQLRILVGSLGVQTKQLDELQNQKSQNDLILAVQKEANELAAEQIERLKRIYWAIPSYIP